MKVGEDFEGFVELATSKEIQGNGPPVAQVRARFVRLQADSLPTSGHVSAMVQHLSAHASAPPEWCSGVLEPEANATPEANAP